MNVQLAEFRIIPGYVLGKGEGFYLLERKKYFLGIIPYWSYTRLYFETMSDAKSWIEEYKELDG